MKISFYLGIAFLIIGFALMAFSSLLPVNDYRAQGINALDCDGPLSILIFLVPAFLSVLVSLVLTIFSLAKRRPETGKGHIACILLCVLLLAWGVRIAWPVLDEMKKNRASCAAKSTHENDAPYAMRVLQ